MTRQCSAVSWLQTLFLGQGPSKLFTPQGGVDQKTILIEKLVSGMGLGGKDLAVKVGA
jgi:hypothetical protein